MSHLKNVRIVVLGIDGLGVSVLKKITNLFPGLSGLKKLCDPLHLCSVLSELPELSSVNWTSFYTGEGPERHGIFGFVHINPADYRVYLTNFNEVRTNTIFDVLGKKGFLCKVINLPNTYPARPINGVLVSGFVVEEFEKAVYPKFLIPILKSIKYVTEADATKALDNRESFLKELVRSLESRKRLVHMLWRDLAWNLFVVVLTEFDRLCHFFFTDIFEPSSAYNELCFQVIKKINEILEDIFDRFEVLPDIKRLIVMSDHGFDRLDVEVDLNVWLKGCGLLSFSKNSKIELDFTGITEKTLAFALDPGRIYLHKKGVFSRGKVTDSDYSLLLKEVKEGLCEICYKGKKVINHIYTKDELYPKCTFVNAPDLICVPERHIDLKAKSNRKQLFGFYERTGVHTFDDALFWDSEGKKITRLREAGKEILNFFKGRMYV